MKSTKRVYDMTDRELRAYKRKLRRQREQRKRMLAMMATVLLVFGFVCSYHSFTARANDANTPVAYKYYTDVVVKSGESLWTISDRYVDYSQYKNKQAYIDEVCSINNLYDGSDIRSGQRIVVPYYSTEFVR